MPAYRVESRPLVQTVVATGRVVAASTAAVGSEITGVVLERLVKEGDEVAPGEVLAVLRADDLEAQVREAKAALEDLVHTQRPQAQVRLREAEAKLAQAQRETARRRELFARKLLSREAVEQAAQAETVAAASVGTARLTAAALAPDGSEEATLRARLAAAEAGFAKTRVRSQIAGKVLTRNAEPGDVVQPGQVLFTIARSGRTELLVPVDEKNLGALALGQHARCVADAYPDRVFDAVVTLIAPRVDPDRGTVDVRLAVAPAPPFLIQDMTVSVNIEAARRERAVAVPNDAVTDRQGHQARVYAVRDGRVAAVAVTLGLEGLGMSEITEGLRAGDVVLRDPDATKVGRRVRVAVEPAGSAAYGDDRNRRNRADADRNAPPAGFE